MLRRVAQTYFTGRTVTEVTVTEFLRGLGIVHVLCEESVKASGEHSTQRTATRYKFRTYRRNKHVLGELATPASTAGPAGCDVGPDRKQPDNLPPPKLWHGNHSSSVSAVLNIVAVVNDFVHATRFRNTGGLPPVVETNCETYGGTVAGYEITRRVRFIGSRNADEVRQPRVIFATVYKLSWGMFTFMERSGSLILGTLFARKPDGQRSVFQCVSEDATFI